MAYWHIRMNQEGQNLASDVWKRGKVGMWLKGGLGGLEDARKKDHAAKAIAQELYGEDIKSEKVKEKTAIDWARTALKFRGRLPESVPDDSVPSDSVKKGDWVYTCFGGGVHVAGISSDVEQAEAKDPKTLIGEEFIYRTIKDRTSFALGDLPECYRLLSGVGRTTLCHPVSYW